MLPIPHRAHTLHLLAHTLDIGIGPLFGVDVVGNGGVFGG